MRIVVAPDSFKGTATAAEIASAVSAGWRSVRPDDTVDEVPMADGGEGTLDAFATALPDAARVAVVVRGPDDRPVQTSWLRLPDGRAVVELAATSGITLLDDPRPDDAHTVGFGQAIRAALDAGVSGLVLGIGGSASTDGGLGLLLALGLGVHPPDLLATSPGGSGLDLVTSVDVSLLRPLPAGGVVVLSDVEAPLVGPAGAAAVFGPQKGVTSDRVAAHDDRLRRWAARFPSVDPEVPGSGAAGGAGFGLQVWGATLRPGAAEVAQVVGLAGRIRGADLVITGEGRFDGQSALGKVPGVVRTLAEGSGVATALVAGSIESATIGFDDAVALTDLAPTPEDAMADPSVWAFRAGARLAERVPAEETR